MNEQSFVLFKSLSLVTALVAVGTLQTLVPHAGGYRDLLRNWRANLPLAAINTALLGSLCGGCVCGAALAAEARGIGLLNMFRTPTSASILFTVILLDLAAWCWHRANHQFAFLWRFHAVHHSDAVFDASTALRFHPGELLISLGVRLAVVVAFGLPIVGILVFEIVFGFFNVFVHGNVRLPRRLESVLDALLVTPAVHRRHHAAATSAAPSNFGTILAIWDRMAKTFVPTRSTDRVVCGIADFRLNAFAVKDLLTQPFRKL